MNISTSVYSLTEADYKLLKALQANLALFLETASNKSNKDSRPTVEVEVTSIVEIF